jgi:monoamine oxidase
MNGDQAPESLDVVVVGAGLAGLSAARTLTEAGARTVVLEARDRVGGRTLGRPLGGGMFDMGGQFVGPGQDRIKEVAKEFDVELMPMYSTGKKLQDFGGHKSTYRTPFPTTSLWKPFPFWNLINLGVAMGKFELQRRLVPLDAPWNTPWSHKWDATSIEAWKRSNPLRPRQVGGMLDAILRPGFGSEASEVSVLNFLFFLQTAGGLMGALKGQTSRFVYGSQQLSLKLAEHLGPVVRLNEPVRAIAQDGSGVRVRSDARTWEARYVIVTVPVPLSAHIQYTPPLPGLRVGLIERLPMGSEVKIFATYDKPFWRDAGLSGEVVSDGDPVSVVFDNSMPDGSQAALLALVGGKHAHTWNLRPADERRRAVLQNFVRWFGPKAAEPTGYVEFDWRMEEWSRGCPLAVMTPGAWLHFGKALREPVGRIFWAGSELAEEWCTYMNGAITSGEGTARAILERHDLAPKSRV